MLPVKAEIVEVGREGKREGRKEGRRVEKGGSKMGNKGLTFLLSN